MTTLDKINSAVDSTMSMVFDKEPLNYLEAAGLYGIVAAGRQSLSALEVLYNQAHDRELRAIIKMAIDEQTKWLVERAEKFLAAASITLPSISPIRRRLHDSPPQIPDDARFTDQEIILAIANLAKVSQMAVLGAMHQTYKPEIAMIYREILDAAFDFNYRLLKLTLDKGWLPHLAKVEH
jgi:hypothetical protein